MIKIFLFILFTCIAVAIGPMLADNQGFVHISTGHYVIETSVNTAITFYVLSILLLFVLYTILKKCINIPAAFRVALKTRAFRKKLSIQDEAIVDFFQGQYEQSLGLLKHANSLKKMSEKSLLVAAYSAFKMEKYEFTRNALDELASRSYDDKISATAIRAKLNYDIGNSKVALEYLDALNGALKNKYIYELYLNCYKSLKQYDKIIEKSNDFIRLGILDEAKIRDYYLLTVENKLLKVSSLQELEELISKLTKQDKKDPKIMGPVIFRLVRFGDTQKARDYTLSLLKDGVDNTLLESIAHWDVTIHEVLVALKKFASKNTKESQTNHSLLRAMGNLEYRSGLLAEALSDYKQALSIESSPEVLMRIGSILVNMQKFTEAAEYFSKANANLGDSTAIRLLPVKE